MDIFSRFSTALDSFAGPNHILVIFLTLVLIIILDAFLLNRLSFYRKIRWGVIMAIIMLTLSFINFKAYQKYINSYTIEQEITVGLTVKSEKDLIKSPFGPDISEYSSIESLSKPISNGIVLCLDVSGSMKENDPDMIVFLASRLFTDLADPAHHLGIVFFDNRIVKQVDFMEVESGEGQADSKTAIKDEIDYYYRADTDISLAVETAMDMLSELDDNFGKYIIVMSDVDIENDSGAVPIDTGLKSQLADDNITLFAIGLGEKASTDEMKKLTYETPIKVMENSELIDAFKQVLSTIWDTKEIEVFPGRENDYLLDNILEIAREINVVAYDDRIELINFSIKSPNGPMDEEELNSGDNYYIKTDDTDHYMVSKIFFPSQYGDGEWSVGVNKTPESVSFIQVLNVGIDAKLSFDFHNKTISAKNAYLINYSDGSIYDDEKFYRDFNFNIILRHDDGDEQSFPLEEIVLSNDNEIIHTYKFEGLAEFGQPGSYEFFINFTNKFADIRSEKFYFEFSEENQFTINSITGGEDEILLRNGQGARIFFEADENSSIGPGQMNLYLDEDTPLGGLYLSGYQPDINSEDANYIDLYASGSGVTGSGTPAGNRDINMNFSQYDEDVVNFNLNITTKKNPSALFIRIIIAFSLLAGPLNLLIFLFRLAARKYFPPRFGIYHYSRSKPLTLGNSWVWPFFHTQDKNGMRFDYTEGSFDYSIINKTNKKRRVIKKTVASALYKPIPVNNNTYGFAFSHQRAKINKLKELLQKIEEKNRRRR